MFCLTQFAFIHPHFDILSPCFLQQFHLRIQQQHLPPNTQHPPWSSFLLEVKLSPKFTFQDFHCYEISLYVKKNAFLCFISNHSNPFVSQVKKGFNIWMFPKIGAFPPKWMVKIMENPINPWMIWGENPLFLETSIYIYNLNLLEGFES